MKTAFKFKSIVWAAISLALFATSCQKEADLFGDASDDPSLKSVTTLSGGNSVKLFAGQTIDVGNLIFDDVDTNGDGTDDALKVTYSLTNNWQLTEIHFWIGQTLSEMPVNKAGNPVVGNFPYKFTNLGGASSHTITIPFSAISYELSDKTYFIAAHASVRLPNSTGYQTETAWGDGLRMVQRGNWAMYFTINILPDAVTDQPESVVTETAFAYNASYAKTFISQGFNGRWGWTNGPLPAGNYTFTLYAGAGNNDLSKGTNVGTVSLNYNGSSASVTYSLNAPYKIEEAHLHLGTDVLPLKNGEYTIAPGQYPYTKTNTGGISSYTFNVSGLSGDIYLAAHATVSGF